MRNNIKIVLSMGVLAIATMACMVVTGGGQNPPSPTPGLTVTVAPPLLSTETDIPPVVDEVLLRDDFTSIQWGTGTDTDLSIEYLNGTLQFIIYTNNRFYWSTPNDLTYQNVRIEVTTINNNSDPTTALGIMCNKNPAENSFYYFAITPAGQYAIVRATDGESDVFLTNDNKWAFSDLIAKNASSYRLGADCGNGTLKLYVDGNQIDSASDVTYQSGEVGLFVWSGEEATNTNVAFDDFSIIKIPE